MQASPQYRGASATMPKEIIDVNTGEVKVAFGLSVLRSVAIGSCVVVAALDSEKRVGAMTHIMLPGKAPENCLEKTKYATDAIEKLIEGMNQQGCKNENIEVCLVGAGNVLQKEDDTICHANIESVISILKDKIISIKASILGGTKRKSVMLNIENGSFHYTEGGSCETLLWKADSIKY